MTNKTVSVGDLCIGNEAPFVLLGGVNVLESRDFALLVAEHYVEACTRLGIPFVFKASYDKANRSSRSSFRGPGIEAGLKVLEDVRAKFGVPVLTDVHEDTPLSEVAAVVDVLQTPAFLCRQTNFIVAAASQGKPVNIKKGQFLSPWEMQNVVDKARSTGNPGIMVCERGFSFGYNNLVSDMRSLAVMRGTGCPVVFDATHSVQLPGGQGSASGGQREFVPVLARAAVAAGVAGLFICCLRDRHGVIERVESIRQVICIRRHHQRAIFISRLLYGIREARDLFDKFDLVLG